MLHLHKMLAFCVGFYSSCGCERKCRRDSPRCCLEWRLSGDQRGNDIWQVYNMFNARAYIPGEFFEKRGQHSEGNFKVVLGEAINNLGSV